MKKYISSLAGLAVLLTIAPVIGVYEAPQATAASNDPQPMYSGIATVGFYNGQPHSVFTHVNFPGVCNSPVVVTQTMVDGILCGNGSGPTVCPNDPSTTSIDLRAYPANITSTGFDVFLSAMNGVWVGANSPAFPISWQATCGNNPMVPAIADGKTISGVGNATFQNGHSNAIPGPISIPQNCQNPSLVSQTQIESVLCGNTSGPTICPNDPSTTSQDLMSRVSRTDVSVSGNNGVWLGANSPLFPVSYHARCENTIGSTERVYGGIVTSGFYNGEAQTRPLHISLPPNCADSTIVTQSLNDSVLCGNGSGPTVCPSDPSTTSVDLTSFAYASGDGYNLILSAMDGVWVGANSYAFPIAYHITCKDAPVPPVSVPDQSCSVPTSALRNLPGLVSVSFYEMTGGYNIATFPINDNRLVNDINQSPSNFDFSSDASEYYDVFFSNEHGVISANGAYITVDTFRNNSLQDGATGNNIDAVVLNFADGHKEYATLVAHTDLGTGLSASYQQSRGFAQNAVGVPDGSPTYLGDQHSRLTLGMCDSFRAIPQCRDGIDNDGDGATDYPSDYSCAGPDDNDETNPKSQCQDGIDNDNDGLVDYPQDPGCSSYQDNNETNGPQCSDGVDNADPEDTLADYNDPGCYTNGAYNPNDNDETNVQTTPQCRDGIDNDGDGAIDYPADFSCSGPDDNDETNPKSSCQDGIDNDNDGLVDYPQDPGCSSKQDNDESNAAQTGCIDIVKETFDPWGNPLPITAQFTFMLDGVRTTVNASNGRAKFTGVPAGIHTVTETVPSGWRQLLVTPVNGSLNVPAGTTCAGVVFKNQQYFGNAGTSSSRSSSQASTCNSWWGCGGGGWGTANLTVQTSSAATSSNTSSSGTNWNSNATSSTSNNTGGWW